MVSTVDVACVKSSHIEEGLEPLACLEVVRRTLLLLLLLLLLRLLALVSVGRGAPGHDCGGRLLRHAGHRVAELQQTKQTIRTRTGKTNSQNGAAVKAAGIHG